MLAVYDGLVMALFVEVVLGVFFLPPGPHSPLLEHANPKTLAGYQGQELR